MGDCGRSSSQTTPTGMHDRGYESASSSTFAELCICSWGNQLGARVDRDLVTSQGADDSGCCSGREDPASGGEGKGKPLLGSVRVECPCLAEVNDWQEQVDGVNERIEGGDWGVADGRRMMGSENRCTEGQETKEPERGTHWAVAVAYGNVLNVPPGPPIPGQSGPTALLLGQQNRPGVFVIAEVAVHRGEMPGADNCAPAIASAPPTLALNSRTSPSQTKPSPKLISPATSARSPLSAKPPGFTTSAPFSNSAPVILAPSSFTSPENRHSVSRRCPATLRFAALKPGIALPIREVNPTEAQYKSGLTSNQQSSRISALRTSANARLSSPATRALLSRIMGSSPASPGCSPNAREAITSARTTRSSPHPGPSRGSSEDGSPTRRSTSALAGTRATTHAQLSSDHPRACIHRATASLTVNTKTSLARRSTHATCGRSVRS